VRKTHLSEDEAKEAGKKALGKEEVEGLTLANARRVLAPIAYFTCDVALGNSMAVEEVVSFADANTVFGSSTMYDSKRCAYDCWVSHEADCMFGCDHVFYSQFCINCYRSLRLQRCFEVSDSLDCSDCHFCHNCEGLRDCMFCFNAKNLRHAIGNVQLPKEKYYEVKKRLQSEMAGMLKNEKRLPSLMEIVARCGKPGALALSAAPKEEKGDKKVIEEAWARTCNVLLGKRLKGGIDDYGEWLKKDTRRSEVLESAASGRPVRRFDYCRYFELPSDRLLLREEAREAGEKLKIGDGAVESLTVANAHERIGGVAFFCPEYRDGMNLNIIECATSGDSAHCYRSSPIVYSKYAGYCFWPRSSEHSFGCGALLSSEFNIRCFNSVKLSRCFEVDFSRDCSGCYYCHNVENCRDCLFCFNVKNLKYAVGNVEVGRERFMAIKARVLEDAAHELEGKKGLRWGIYNIGAK
jgi:hypothetical protein